ncbi:MAG: hypothetical protein JSV76_04645 [Candidatus Bathyarchaeota archaeon]|nr:MAG: hypothetical protein JSV76_04645 [Candidatus Bathyarchaeota archaeon]
MTKLHINSKWNWWKNPTSKIDFQLLRPLVIFVLGFASSIIIETSFFILGYGIVEHVMALIAAISIIEFIGRLSGWSRAYLLGWVMGFVLCGRFFLPFWKYLIHFSLSAYYLLRELQSSIDDKII